MTDSLPMQEDRNTVHSLLADKSFTTRRVLPSGKRVFEAVVPYSDVVEAFARHRLSTRPAPASPPGLVEIAASAVHAHLSRRNVMQYLDNPEDCEGIAQAVIAALSPDARVLPIEGEA